MWNEDTQPSLSGDGRGQQRPEFIDIASLSLVRPPRVLVKTEWDVGGDTLAWNRCALKTRMASC